MKKIAIFASGSGSNAENIVRYFQSSEHLNIECIYSNNPGAFVLQRAEKYHVPTVVFDRETFYHSDAIVKSLKAYGVDMLVLAGFMWLVPKSLTDHFIIVNIHPALLPKYGGKGMYGDRVHRAVVANGEKESGITIHYVNENYDEGQIIFQARCAVHPEDTPEMVAGKVHQLEYEHYPRVIGELVANL